MKCWSSQGYIHQDLFGVALVYVKKLLSFKEGASYSLRSITSKELKVSKTKCKTLGDRAFALLGPSLWNTLPWAIRRIWSVQGLKQALKTFLFPLAFAQWSNRPLALRDHLTNASFKQWIGILMMPKTDRAHKNYLTSKM